MPTNFCNLLRFTPLAIAGLLSACAVHGDVRGERASSPPSQAVEHVAILVVSRPNMQLQTLFPALRNLQHNIDKQAQVTSHGAAVLEATVPELEAALSRAKLRGSVTVADAALPSSVTAQASHIVLIQPQRMSHDASTRLTVVYAVISVHERKTGTLIWSGESTLSAGSAGIVRNAVEARRVFATQVVAAVSDFGAR